MTAARRAQPTALEVRYEELADDPVSTARELAAHLDAPENALAFALGRAHGTSVGRYRDDLTEEQLEDVLAEAGELLRELGYTCTGTTGAVPEPHRSIPSSRSCASA